MLEYLKSKAKELKKQIVLVYLAYMHNDVKCYQKAFLLLILIYAVSPIDLIPDFIPILGMLDEIILLPLGIMIAMKMIPQRVWEECKMNADKGIHIKSKYKKMGAALIILIWAVLLISVIKGLL